MLHFNGLEPVDFKGKQCQPVLDAEKRLRLQSLTFKNDTDTENDKINSALCDCFEEKYAKDFIKTKLSFQDKQILRTYLVGGETGLNRLSKATDGAIEQYITRALESTDGDN